MHRQFKRPILKYLFRCAAAAAGLVLSGGVSAEERDQVLTLIGAASEVTLVISAGVPVYASPSSSSLTIHVDYPSGKAVKEPVFPRPSTVRALFLPIPPGGSTRAEGLVRRALLQRPAQPAGREWLVSDKGGMRVYAYRTRTGEEPETHVFSGSDGSLVGVQRGYSVLLMNEGSRRYMQRLEVLYQYPRELDVRMMDAFLLGFIQRNISVQ